MRIERGGGRGRGGGKIKAYWEVKQKAGCKRVNIDKTEIIVQEVEGKREEKGKMEVMLDEGGRCRRDGMGRSEKGLGKERMERGKNGCNKEKEEDMRILMG